MARSAKVSPELLALHRQYQEALERGVPLTPRSATIRVVEDRVLIDATASGDGRQLEADLVALGMRHAATFGPVVSGQLPIAAIPKLEALSSLAFARPSAARTRSPAR